MMKHTIKRLLLPALFAASMAFMTAAPSSAQATEITVYKSPTCGCCSAWIDHMKANGYTVVSKNVEDMETIKQVLGVPNPFQSCHTAMVDGYIVEGHVPAADVSRMLAEKPKVTGIAVPGMPAGSPGMEVGSVDNYDVLLFKPDGSATVYASY